MYVTDVRAAGDTVHGVEIPDDINASTEYPIADAEGRAEPARRHGVGRLRASAAGRKVLIADGFKQP